LLAKLVVHLPSGDPAALADKAARALAELRVDGLATNADFLRALLTHADVRAQRVTTDWIDAHLPALVDAAARLPRRPGAAPAAATAIDVAVEVEAPPDAIAVRAPLQGTVVSLDA